MSRTNETLRLFAFFVIAALLAAGDAFAQTAPIRPPAVPLATLDPYFSIWSFADSLHTDWTRHWTGSTNGMGSMVRIDGRPYRLMGRTPESDPPLPQTSLAVSATRTVYTFSGPGGGRSVSHSSRRRSSRMSNGSPDRWRSFPGRFLNRRQRSPGCRLFRHRRGIGGQHSRPGRRLGTVCARHAGCAARREPGSARARKGGG